MSGRIADITSWSATELQQHAARLERVTQAVASTHATARGLVDDNAKAYGMLFGWLAGPALNKVCRASSDFGQELTDALAASTESVRTAAQNYQAVDDGNARSVQAVLAELRTGHEHRAGV